MVRSDKLRHSLLLKIQRGEPPRRASHAGTEPSPDLRIYERIGVLEEEFGKDDSNERVEKVFRNIMKALPQMLGPELSNIENDEAYVLANRRDRSEGRRAEVTTRETDRLPSTWSTIRIV